MKVHVKTPARLHLGLIDLNGELGRMFGGLGVGIDRPNVVLEAESSKGLFIEGKESELVTVMANRFLATYRLEPNVHIKVRETIPPHVGLGSGTQLSLAVATALARLFGVNASIQQLTFAMNRARRTGVGTAIFEQGGFVVDGGKRITKPDETAKFPPLIYRQPFPEQWRFIIAIPNLAEGLSNSEENHAFDRLTKMPADEVGKICRLIMLKLLPALSEVDIKSFGEALTSIQQIIGGYFSQVQGGKFTRPDIEESIEFLREIGAYGVGQSSWGPALYGVIKAEQSKEALKQVKTYLRKRTGGDAFIARANNRGATIKLVK